MKNPYLMAPGDTLDFTWPWNAWLPAGDTIASHTVVPGEHVSIGANGPVTPGITAFATLAASAPVGTNTFVACSVVTTGGRTFTRSIRILAGRP